MTEYEKQLQRIKYAVMSDGAKIGYEELGSGDKYVFCSMMDHAETTYVRKFADYGYHVILVWNRSCGPSAEGNRDKDFENDWYNRWADDVCEIADSLGVKQFIYTGASHGAGTGWHILWRHQERVSAFIALVCGPHPLNGETSCLRDKLAQNPEFDPFNYESDDPEVLKRRAAHMEYHDEIQKYMSSFNYRRPMVSLGSEEALIELLKTFKTPTLMLCGLEDAIIEPKYNLRTAQALPNCKLVFYSQSGHSFLHHEAVEETMEESLNFLRNLEENNGRIYKKLEK